MKIAGILLSLIMLFSACEQQQTKEDVIDKIWKATGGKKNWQKARYLTFVFAPQKEGKTTINRTHLWDRYTGDYRLEAKTADDRNLLVLFNVNTKKGTAYINETPQTDSLNIKEIDRAYKYFINDSYWLLAPLKLEDEGVNVTLRDHEVVDGKDCNVLHLTFGNVGITPGDQYWLYADSETGEIVQWKFLLQSKSEGTFRWTNYKDLGGGLRLATHKQNLNQNAAITFPDARVLKEVEQGRFIKN